MNKNKIIAGVVVLLLLAGGAFMLFGNSQKSADQKTTEQYGSGSGTVTSPDGNIEVTVTPSKEKTFTAADVSSHNSAASCYTSVNENVYDVTSYINKHPGGSEAVLSLCGKDGSSAFNDQHGGQSKPEAMLATLKIGILTK
jgi:cytochrome b involved in lipid metabolism